MSNVNNKTQGIFYAVIAYLMWGIAPIYYNLLFSVPAVEIISHRIFWSIIFIFLLVLLTQRWPAVEKILYYPKKLLALIISSLLIGVNWFVYIWAIGHDQLLQSSMGYFIMPLVMVILGVVFLKERLSQWQIVGVLLASVGVYIEIISAGNLPWIALTEAITFSVYSLIRKYIDIDVFAGLLIETLILYPFALYFLFLIPSQTGAIMENTWELNVTLILVGILMTVPLFFFMAASNRMRLSSLGILQYISPTIMFFLAVYLYNEPFVISTFISFSFIWVGLIFFSLAAFSDKKREQIILNLTE